MPEKRVRLDLTAAEGEALRSLLATILNDPDHVEWYGAKTMAALNRVERKLLLARRRPT